MAIRSSPGVRLPSRLTAASEPQPRRRPGWLARALGMMRSGRADRSTRPRGGWLPRPGPTPARDDDAADRATITLDPAGLRPGTSCYTATGSHQRGPNKIEVLVPDDLETGRSYPVVYLLPVNTGTDGPWGSGIAEARRGDLHNRHRAIFVAPAFDSIPWYGDNPLRPEVRQSAYLSDVVIPFVDREFPTVADPAGRFVVGFSKSGLGALSLFLRRPDLFGRVAAFDPALAPTPAKFLAWDVVHSYGTRANFDRCDPMTLLRSARSRLRGRVRRIVLLAGGPSPRLGADRYRARLAELHIPFVFIAGSNMAHTWSSGWLPLAIAALAPETAAGPR